MKTNFNTLNYFHEIRVRTLGKYITSNTGETKVIYDIADHTNRLNKWVQRLLQKFEF